MADEPDVGIWGNVSLADGCAYGSEELTADEVIGKI